MSPIKRRERLCSFPGCKFLTLGRFCEQHTQATAYHTSAAVRESKKFLNSAVWINLRRYKLSLTPWCEHCQKPATQVDHIKPRHTHPELRLDFKNLQSLCDECHGRKTRSEDKQVRY